MSCKDMDPLLFIFNEPFWEHVNNFIKFLINPVMYLNSRWSFWEQESFNTWLLRMYCTGTAQQRQPLMNVEFPVFRYQRRRVTTRILTVGQNQVILWCSADYRWYQKRCLEGNGFWRASELGSLVEQRTCTGFEGPIRLIPDYLDRKHLLGI